MNIIKYIVLDDFKTACGLNTRVFLA